MITTFQVGVKGMRTLKIIAAIAVLSMGGIAATPSPAACSTEGCNVLLCADCRSKGDMYCDGEATCECYWWDIVDQ